MPEPAWIRIEQLQARFEANLAALASRYPQVAQTLAGWVLSRSCVIQAAGDTVVLGVESCGAVQPLPGLLSPAVATATVNKMFPDGKYQIAMIAGEDLGWLWNRLYRLPCSVPNIPGFRPPLFFLMQDIERLRIILHIQDWADLLADSRVRLFVGDDCVKQFRQSLLEDLYCPLPTLWVTVNPDIWPEGFDVSSIFTEARTARDAQLTLLVEKQAALAQRSTPQSLAARFAPNRPLRVLGITSRYTTFLQHSMRDWLDGFDRLGHTTRLEIEHADHELANSLVLARTCDEFDPDLIVSIDHYRKSMVGAPGCIPMVMWIQDALPALFSKEAGAAQEPLDFSMTIDPLKMIHEYGYPADRTMSALIGVNENRFRIPAETPTSFACDVCLVSHASTPADVLLQQYLDGVDSRAAKDFWQYLFDRLRQIYSQGRMVTNPILLKRLVEQSMRETKVTISPDQMGLVEFVFGTQINNAFFRHQSLQWLADAGFNLHIYGKGWEKHPTLARFARGVADNQTQLSSIYRSSAINLQISPFGAVHQRVMEGLASGGFFMLRFCAGDMLDRLYKTIWDFCQARRISTDSELQQQATPGMRAIIQQVADILQEDPFACSWSFMETLRSAAESGYVRSAASVWGDDYDAVAFNSAAELSAKVTHFLQNPQDRAQRAESMRKTVLERFTYVQTARRLVDFVRERLQGRAV